MKQIFRKKPFLALLSVALFLGCGHHKVKFDPSEATVSNAEKKLQAQLIWVKNKPDSLDFLIQLTNQYPGSLLFRKSAIKMTFNDVAVPLKKSGFSGEIVPGGVEKEVVIFQFDQRAKRHGKALLTIDPITMEAPPVSGAKGKTSDKPIPPLKMEIAID